MTQMQPLTWLPVVLLEISGAHSENFSCILSEEILNEEQRI